jgi:hypothetical protein
MKIKFFVIALFLIISNVAVAQWPTQGGLGGSSNCGGMMHRPMPDAPQIKSIPPFLKGDQTLAETWNATIAMYGNNPDGMYVDCFAEDSDNLYIGGDFQAFDTVIPADFIVQYNRKTGVWSSLSGGLDNHVSALTLHNGILYAAGSFDQTYDGGTTLNYIAEWDGISWQSVGGGTNAEVRSIAFIGDTLYAGGNFTQAGGNSAYFLAYWDGQNWNEAFGGTSYPVYTLLGTHDSLFVGGDFNYVGSEQSASGEHAFGIAMLQNGTWTTFGNDGCYASTLAIFQGQLWVGGDFYGTANGGYLVNDIAYWDGSNWNSVSADTSIGTNGTGPVDQLLVIGDTLLALGQFSSMNGVSANGIAMFHDSNWSQVAGGLYGYGLSAIPFNGNLYVGGEFTQVGSAAAMAIASLSGGNWTPVTSMVSPLVGWESAEVRAIATTERYVFLGGNFTTITGNTCNHVAAWDKQLQSWTTLGSGVNGDVYSLAVQGDNLIVGGYFNHAGSIFANNIAEYNITTKLWSAMGGGARRSVGAIAIDSSGGVYAAIYNPLIGNTYYDYLGAWDGTNWSTYGNGLNSGYISGLIWQGPILYAAGSFLETDDRTRVNYVAQLQDSIWISLNNGLNGEAGALVVSGDSLYVGGAFTEADGQVDTSLAVWNNTTQEWNPIGAAGFNGPVLTLAADGKGGVYAGGEFSEVAQVGRGRLVHWNGSTFGSVSSGANNTVEALATDETALYAGGWFTAVDNGTITSLHFAALDGAGASVSISPLPDVSSLSIYPNPSSNSSTVSVVLAKAGNIRIEIFNALGTRVALLADGNYQAGQEEFTLDAAKLLSGIYFLRLTNDGVSSMENFVVQ